jgi:hypothetical protein
MTQGKWIDFNEAQSKTKTKIFWVQNRNDNSLIGEVRWYGPWRQYAFYPMPNTVYERQCLMDITKFIHYLMMQRKLQKQLIQS